MVPLTRRTLLSSVAGVSAALAGCSGIGESDGGSTRTAPRDDSPDGPMSGSTTEPETLLLRMATDRPPIWLAEPGEDDGRPTVRQRNRWRNHVIVDEASRADLVTVAESADREAVDAFLAATEFDDETVYIEMGEVRECFRLELCHVGWSASEISTDYTRKTRPYTDHCEVDESVIEARLIRIPSPLDDNEVNGFSSSIGTGACDRHRTTVEGEGGASPTTPRENSTPTETPTADSGGEQ